MEKTRRKIRTVAYIHVGERLVCVDTLSDEQRAFLAATLNYRLFCELYRGKAEFEIPSLTPKEEIFADIKNKDQIILYSAETTNDPTDRYKA